jgi:hypothetical protein
LHLLVYKIYKSNLLRNATIKLAQGKSANLHYIPAAIVRYCNWVIRETKKTKTKNFTLYRFALGHNGPENGHAQIQA